jgi:hypothetical protein
MRQAPRSFARTALASCLFFVGACSGGDPVDQAPVAPVSNTGPRVRWDLGARPLPEVPLPNDVATWADPTSPTGLRVNASMIAPTAFESALREGFNELDGWGTFQPITLSFDADLDLANLTRRMQRDDHAFPNDAVYLVNLRTGLPIPLDMGDGNFVYTARNRDGYYPNDPRGGQSNLLLETVHEDTNGNGTLDPGEDTNFDGVLNRAALFPPNARPEDALSTYWEPDSRTLILRPIVPLEERTRYAVVITSRLTGPAGRPVRSPFPTVAHPSQAQVLEGLDALIRARPQYYGPLAYRPRASDPSDTDRVAFAWSFTTQTTVTDMLTLRRGLYGEGPFGSKLAPITPDLHAAFLPMGGGCTADQRARPHVIRGEALGRLVTSLADAFGVSGMARQRLIETYRYVDYIVVGTYRTPYLMGDPQSRDHQLHWTINSNTGQIEHLGTDTVQFVLTVPKALGEHRAPFPVTFMGHGYTGALTDALGFGPNFAMHGIATIGINAAGHGPAFSGDDRSVVGALLGSICAGGVTSAILNDRARDLNGDGNPDSGGDFWTAYTFHTRDMVRQSVLDHMQLIRAMRGFDGRARALDDFNGDGNATNDLAGDFNGDGTVDIGGPDARYFTLGGSLGGILSMILGSADASVRAAAPVSGGGGLTDVGIRSTQGGVKEAVILRIMGPLVVSIPARTYTPDGMRTRTACSNDQNTLRFIVPDLNDTGELEFACLNLGEPGSPSRPGGPPSPAVAPGDDVVITNLRTRESRCARAGTEGRFRIGVPSNVNDPLIVTILRGSVITDFGTCRAQPDAQVKSTVSSMLVVEGDCDIHCGRIPPNSTATSPTRHWTEREAPLLAPAEGMGVRRQTPDIRRFLLLAQAALDPGDPISFAPLYFLKRPDGHAQHALLVVNTAGDQAVPVSTGNAFARAAGVIPFFQPNAWQNFPEFADYTAPQRLYVRHGGRTPNRVLIDQGVLEGLSSLNRFPSSMRPDALFDVDNLDEGRQMFGEQALTPPLRLVRYATSARDQGPDAPWQPTIADSWAGTRDPVASLLNAYIVPQGTHSIGLTDPRLPWEPSTYLLNIIGHFFATDGRDLYYRSHPSEHQCAATNRCSFNPPLPAAQ